MQLLVKIILLLVILKKSKIKKVNEVKAIYPNQSQNAICLVRFCLKVQAKIPDYIPTFKVKILSLEN